MDFDSHLFDTQYSYRKKDLGATIEGDFTVFKLWAPTAQNVTLNLFKDGHTDSLIRTVEMKSGLHGVWTKKVRCSHGTYYTYSVTVDGQTQEAVDPYAKAGGVNGKRAMVVDLSVTNPKNFDNDSFVYCESIDKAIIWETHVRDFSNKITSSQYRGKYLAFTETGLKNASGISVGVDYLKKLGITHVQLQPVFDYGSGDEANQSTWYNWGYDPANYNFPEGSYSTDPFNGEVRIREFKQMVQALHNEGIGVIMDVVYNHTFFIDSNLGKTVPYYYYRYKGWNEPSNGSGCGNEIASERTMVRKYIVDSILYWQKEYHIDGFRFDLMALHDIETIKEISEKVHKNNPSALIYGEPWTGGDSALPYHKRAVRENLPAKSNICVFNDTIRDGLKGSTFNVYDRGYINGCVNRDSAGKIVYGIGSEHSVNYMSCHDNFTLWDKLTASAPEASTADRLAMNRLGISIIMISKGTPFFLSGEEMLRSKNGDGNSYMSPDRINNLEWSCLTKTSDQYKMVRFYRNLCKMRKENTFISESDISFTVFDNNVIKAVYTQGCDVKGCAIINPHTHDIKISADKYKDFTIVFNGTGFSSKENMFFKTITVKAKSVVLLKSN